MGIEEALVVGAQRAYVAARGMDDGHLPSVVGQLRHFHMNESFQRALAVNDASPSPIRGNAIVTGRTGVFTLARFNIKEGLWVNGRRSQTRRQMSVANMAIEPLVQPELFADYVSFSEDGCAKCQKPNALQQQRGLNPSGNDGRQAARSSHSSLRDAEPICYQIF